MMPWKSVKKKSLIHKWQYFVLLVYICGCSCHSELIISSDISSARDICKDILIQEGFEIAVNKPQYLSTNWKVNLSPYQKKGRKEQTQIQIKPHNAQIKLEVIVAQYINYSTQDYLNETSATWVKSGRNRMREKWLIALIKNKLLLTE